MKPEELDLLKEMLFKRIMADSDAQLDFIFQFIPEENLQALYNKSRGEIVAALEAQKLRVDAEVAK